MKKWPTTDQRKGGFDEGNQFELKLSDLWFSFPLFCWRRKMLWWWRSDWYKLSQNLSVRQCWCGSQMWANSQGYKFCFLQKRDHRSCSGLMEKPYQPVAGKCVCELRCCSCKSWASKYNFKMCCIWTGAHSEKWRRTVILIQATAHTRAVPDCCCVLTFKMYE